MKVRMGFVSNSSSSSFVLLVKKDVHEKVLESDKIVGPAKKMLNELCSTVNAFDNEFVSFHNTSANDCSSLFFEQVVEIVVDDQEEFIEAIEVFDEYQGILMKEFVKNKDYVKFIDN
jgi:hypothetical protein